MKLKIDVACECGKAIPPTLFQLLLAGKTLSLKCKECGAVHKRASLLTDKGYDCPLCGDSTRFYHRKINSGMARALFELWSLTELNEDPDKVWWHHAEFDRFGSRETHKLVHWGLVKEKPKPTEREDKRTSGFWRITEKGREFAQNRAKVRKIAVLFNNTLERYDGPEITINDAFGEKFRFDELMEAHRCKVTTI